MKLCNIFCI